jgi:hypothetical protein
MHFILFHRITLLTIRSSLIRVRNAKAIVRSLGPANVGITSIAGNVLRFIVPVPDGTVAGGRSIEGATGNHKLAHCPDRVVTVHKVVGLGAAGHVLGQQARFVELSFLYRRAKMQERMEEDIERTSCTWISNRVQFSGDEASA